MEQICKCGHEHRKGKSGNIANFCVKMDYCKCKKFEAQNHSQFFSDKLIEKMVSKAWKPKTGTSNLSERITNTIYNNGKLENGILLM